MIEVPISVEFTLLGEDKDGLINKVVTASKKYLSPDSTFSQSKATFGERLVVETKIPLGTREALKKSSSARLLSLQIMSVPAPQYTTVSFVDTGHFENFSNELSGINLMLDLDFPPKKTIIRLISDSKDPIDSFAYAVFVAKKPYTTFQRTLNRRESAEIVFKGGEDSIWSEIRPYIGFRDTPKNP